MTIDELEHLVMGWLLTGHDPVLVALRHQYAKATVSQREFSGVGFFTTSSIDPSARRVAPPNFTLVDVHLELVGLEHGAGTVLFIRDGLISQLEGYIFEDAWPEKLELVSMTYSAHETRPNELDIHQVRQAWESKI